MHYFHLVHTYNSLRQCGLKLNKSPVVNETEYLCSIEPMHQNTHLIGPHTIQYATIHFPRQNSLINSPPYLPTQTARSKWCHTQMSRRNRKTTRIIARACYTYAANLCEHLHLSLEPRCIQDQTISVQLCAESQ